MANKSNEEFNIELGKLLQNARKRQKISQDQMSVKIQMSKGHISAIERGACKASVEMLMAYAHVLNMTPNEILKITDDDIHPKLLKIILKLSLQEQEQLADAFYMIKDVFNK